MPVSRDEFEELSAETLDVSKETNTRRVLSFLDRNPEQAFTRSEIADGTGVSATDLGEVLTYLEELRLVAHRSDYWAIDEHRTSSLAGMSHGFAAVEDRFPPEDMSEWDDHAVDPRK